MQLTFTLRRYSFIVFYVEPNVFALVKVKGNTLPETEKEVIINVQQKIEETTPIQKVWLVATIPLKGAHNDNWLDFCRHPLSS